MKSFVFFHISILMFLCSGFLRGSRFIEHNDDIIALIPKIDLHAHLHGSIRSSTLKELAVGANVTFTESLKYDLERCFYLFGLVHKVINTKEAVARIISEVLEDFMSENTIYLELRSTPRSLQDGTTLEEYVQLLVDMIETHNNEHGDKMLVKIILSVDRSKSISEAYEVILLAKDPQFYAKVSTVNNIVRNIVGVDFSGNPLGGRFDDFMPLFDNARDHGLKVTIHSAETKELSETIDAQFGEDETNVILSYGPDRLGHALHLLTYHMDVLLTLKHEGKAIPIEICPTSNFLTLGLNSHADHPTLRKLLRLGYPVSINTDDRGIFDTSMTKELQHVKNSMHLSIAEVVELMVSTIDQIFASPLEMSALRTRYMTRLENLVREYKEDLIIRGMMNEFTASREAKLKLESKQKEQNLKEADLTTFFTM